MPKKNYNNRSMGTEVVVNSEVFFFPKHKPPVAIRAASLKEAEAILKNIYKEKPIKKKL